MKFAALFAFSLLQLVHALPPDASGVPAPMDEETRRWTYASDGRDSNALFDFLRRFPASRHAGEARALLAKTRLHPQGKLVEGDAQCVALIDERANGFLDSYRKNAKFAEYRLELQKGHFATHNSIEFWPQGHTDFSRIEHLIALDLIANRDGRCALHLRWSYGSGLPAGCRCAPADPRYVFESRLAINVLDTYSNFRGAVEACAAEGVAIENHAEAYLEEWIDGKSKWLEVIRDKQRRKATVYPSEAGDADDVEFALPRVREHTVNPAALAKGREGIAAKPAAERMLLCQAAAKQIENARMRTLLSTRLIK